MDYDFSGKVVVVTGATGVSLGVDIAKSFFNAGAKIAICGRDYNRVEAAKNEIGASDMSRVYGAVADMSVVSQCTEFIGKVVDHYGRIDILINNAAVQIAEDSIDISPETWDKTINTKARGYFFCSQAVVKDMIRRGEGGSIIMIGSGQSSVQSRQRLTYACANAAVDQMTRTLAREWGPYGVRINCLQPGSFPSGMTAKRFADNPNEEAKYKVLPLQRRGVPKELSDVCLFIASDKASYITGTRIPVDGGWVLCM